MLSINIQKWEYRGVAHQLYMDLENPVSVIYRLGESCISYLNTWTILYQLFINLENPV